MGKHKARYRRRTSARFGFVFAILTPPLQTDPGGEINHVPAESEISRLRFIMWNHTSESRETGKNGSSTMPRLNTQVRTLSFTLRRFLSDPYRFAESGSFTPSKSLAEINSTPNSKAQFIDDDLSEKPYTQEAKTNSVRTEIAHSMLRKALQGSWS